MARVLAARIDEKQRDVFTGKAVVEERLCGVFGGGESGETSSDDE
jgi:hypothetical protein